MPAAMVAVLLLGEGLSSLPWIPVIEAVKQARQGAVGEGSVRACRGRGTGDQTSQCHLCRVFFIFTAE
jgi:hypothetical protein